MSDPTTAPVLYIEDNQLNQLLVRKILGSYGIPVVLAETGERGLALMASQRPSLLLVDIDLPGMNGLQVVACVRADPALHDLPVIAVTASGMLDDREYFLEAGCDDYLPKPVDPPELLARVEHFLSNGR